MDSDESAELQGDLKWQVAPPIGNAPGGLDCIGHGSRAWCAVSSQTVAVCPLVRTIIALINARSFVC